METRLETKMIDENEEKEEDLIYIPVAMIM